MNKDILYCLETFIEFNYNSVNIIIFLIKINHNVKFYRKVNNMNFRILKPSCKFVK